MRLGRNLQVCFEIYIVIFLIALLAFFGCAAPEIDDVLLETQLQGAQRSIAGATALEAERFAGEEFVRAIKLLSLAREAQEHQDIAQSAEFAYQAELMAQIAAAKARQQQAQQYLVSTREQQYQEIIKAHQHELDIERIRHEITKVELANALKTITSLEHRTNVLSTDISELNDSLRRMELRVLLTEAELLVNIARETHPALEVTADYERAQATIVLAVNLIARAEFTEAEKATTDAQKQANGLYELAIKNRTTETEAKTAARIAIAKAESIVERAQYLNANQHAPQQFQQASTHIQRAKRHMDENQYESAHTRAEQAQKSADDAVAIALLAEYRQQAQSELEALAAEAQQVVNTLKAEIAQQAKTQVPQLELQLYKLATAAFATAEAALLDKDYSAAIEAAAESNDYLQRAIENLRAKNSKKVNLLTAAKRIANASIIELKNGVLIRISGNLFAIGSTQLNNRFFATFTQLAKLLQMESFSSYPVRIEAHTDTIGAADVNQNISHGRAKSVQEFLIAEGRVDEKRLTAIGLGETQPIATDGESPEVQNSRIDIIIKTQE